MRVSELFCNTRFFPTFTVGELLGEHGIKTAFSVLPCSYVVM